jgi:hypothetical protein
MQDAWRPSVVLVGSDRMLELHPVGWTYASGVLELGYSESPMALFHGGLLFKPHG